MHSGTGGHPGSAPRFTRAPMPPAPRVIGTNLAPTHQPSHLIRQDANVVSYERLYTGLQPNGQAASYVLPGTFGRTFRAGRGR